MEASEENEKINSNNNNNLLIEITKELEQIIEFIQINLITNKNINLNEKQEKKNIKLGVKRKKLNKIVKNEDLNNKNEINLNIDEEENDNFALNNKKLKAKINKFERYTNKIIKKVKDILKKINDNKNINLEECKIIENQELIYDYGKYIGSTHNRLREGKGIMYLNDGGRYEGDLEKA